MHLRRRKSTTEVLMENVQDLAERAVDLGEQAVSALTSGAEGARDAAKDAASGAYEQTRKGVRGRVRKDVLPKAKAVAASPLVAGALAKSPIDLPKPPKKSHRLRNALIALALGGASFAATRRWTHSSSATGGSSYTPPSRPAAAPDPVPAAQPSSDASVGADPAPATVPGDGPTMDDLAADAVYPEVGYSEDQPSDDRRPDDASSSTERT